MRDCTWLDHRQKERCTECGRDLTLCKCEDPSQHAQMWWTDEIGQYLRAVFETTDQLEDNSHLFEQLIQTFGETGMALVKHSQQRTPPPNEIYHMLVRLGAIAAVLATAGTAEYAYPE